MQKWSSYYYDDRREIHLYCVGQGFQEHGVFDCFGKLKTYDNDTGGIFSGWPVSVISMIGANNKKTEICVDGEVFTVKAPYRQCKEHLLKYLELHHHTLPLHYIFTDRQKQEHPRMIFIIDKDKYTKEDVKGIFRRG